MTTLITVGRKDAEVPPDLGALSNFQNVSLCSSCGHNIPRPVTIAKQFDKDVESDEVGAERNERNAKHCAWKSLHLPHGVRWVHVAALLGGILLVCLLALLLSGATCAEGGTRNGAKEGSENLSKNIPILPINFSDDVLLPPSHPRIISKQEWLAQPPAGLVDPMESPVPMVIITHTATENCTSQAACTFQVRTMQTYHMESRSWSDIGYNFLVGGDGAVYEGRGWNAVGAHTKGYNLHSVGIAFIGTFNDMLPPARQIEACKNLLKLGVEQGKLTKDYKLYGHRQFVPSLGPGEVLYNVITKWPHFSKEM